MRRAWQVVVGLCVLALVVAVCGCGGSGSTGGPAEGAAAKPPPAPTPTPCKIAFHKTVLGASQIFTMYTNGTGVEQLTQAAQGSNGSPAWSPDGAQLCFISSRDGGYRLYVMNRDGTQAAPLIAGDTGFFFNPDWSPDGARVAFGWNAITPVVSWDVYVCNRDGSGKTPLSAPDDGLSDRSSWWNPAGSSVVVCCTDSANPGDDGLWVIPADGSGVPRYRTLSATAIRNPSWSLVGDQIAFARAGDIWVLPVDADGRATGDPLNLTNSAGATEDYPCWSPDGLSIAYQRQGKKLNSPNYIETMGVATRSVVTLGEGYCPDWSPAVFGG